ncbi:MAG: hypothetical protein AAGD07_14180 [Planctomycetota bacterium]
MMRFSLRGLLIVVTILGLAIGNAITLSRLRRANTELERIREEVGYLAETAPDQIAAARVPVDAPLTYRFRVRVPNSDASSKVRGGEGVPSGPLASEPVPGAGSPIGRRSGSLAPYRIAYSTLLPRGRSNPDWYAAIALSAGESTVTIRIAEDPRDERWKISTLVRDARGTRRIGTVLPDEHTAAFRGTHDVIRTGITSKTTTGAAQSSLRLLDERWLIGDGGLLLYGDQPPEQDQIGVYAELQRADAPL